MGNTSAAEARLDARIRPQIAVLRSRTSYPRRSRGRAAGGPALAMLPGGAEAGQPAGRGCAIAEVREGGEVVAAAAVTANGAIAVARSVIARSAGAPAHEATAAAVAGYAAGRDAVGSDAGAAASPPTRPVRAATPERDAGVIGRGSPRRAAPASPVRLTRRGKIVVGALVALAVAGVTALIWFAIAGQAEAAGPAGLGSGAAAAHTMTRVVVRPGETLWSIAVRTDPTADPRAVIQEIIDDNALRGTAIQVGQVLYVPRV